MDVKKPTYQFSRNEREQVYITLQEYRGVKYVDLRLYFQPEDTEGMHPTRKGLTLEVKHLKKLLTGLELCAKKAVSRQPDDEGG